MDDCVYCCRNHYWLTKTAGGETDIKLIEFVNNRIGHVLIRGQFFMFVKKKKTLTEPNQKERTPF